MAWFTFTDASDETFVVRLDDPEQIAHARELVAGTDTSDARIGGTVFKAPASYNVGWSYQLKDPFFFEMSTEVGDSTMRYIEDHLPEIGGALLPGSVWTGWSSELVEELREKTGTDRADILIGSCKADIVFGKGDRDALFGLGGNDHLIGGAGSDVVLGGGGDDKLAGNSGTDLLWGGRGADLLVGGWGGDWLRGGVGDDILVGGQGRDVLWGGDGSDSFVFNALREGVDSIKDFDGDDHLALKAAAFGNVAAVTASNFVENASGAAADGNDRFIYETDTHLLRFDPDGNGAQDAIVLARLNVAHLSAGDFLLV